MAVSFQSSRFISPTLRGQLSRRLAELAAVLVALAGLGLGLAVVSYHAQDPSFDTVSNAPTLNLAGPVGAGLALSPIFVWLWLGPLLPTFGDTRDLYTRAVISAVVMVVVAALMASSLPTFAWGAVRLRAEWRLVALLGVGLFAGALFTVPWMTLSLLSLGYAVSVPFGIRAAARLTRGSPGLPPGPPATVV